MGMSWRELFGNLNRRDLTLRACQVGSNMSWSMARVEMATSSKLVGDATEHPAVAVAEHDAAHDAPVSSSDDQLPTENQAALVSTSSSIPSIYSIAASLASQAGRLSTAITLQRTKSKASDETESESSPASGAHADLTGNDAAPPASSHAPILLPWQTKGESEEVEINAAIRDKILEMTVFRHTYVDHPGGEEEYLFEFAKYKEIAKELLLCDPNLREMHDTLVPSVIGEIPFWRNFFLRCNSICVGMGCAPYLPEVKSTYSTSAAIASLQRFKREMFLKRQRSTDRLRRNFLTTSSATKTADFGVADLDVTLGDLDLDMDGEIDKELMKRRPSRAADHLQYVSHAA